MTIEKSQNSGTHTQTAAAAAKTDNARTRNIKCQRRAESPGEVWGTQVGASTSSGGRALAIPSQHCPSLPTSSHSDLSRLESWQQVRRRGREKIHIYRSTGASREHRDTAGSTLAPTHLSCSVGGPSDCPPTAAGTPASEGHPRPTFRRKYSRLHCADTAW